jgi:hypothetical protein
MKEKKPKIFIVLPAEHIGKKLKEAVRSFERGLACDAKKNP